MVDDVTTKPPKPFLDPFVHVVNSGHIEIFESLHLSIHLPKVLGYQITKFHLLLALGATVVAAALIWLGRRIKSGEPPNGPLTNMLEALVLMIRDNVARPALRDPHHPADETDANKYTPFLVTLFLFIFVVNLFGMIPFLGSATASIAVTAGLALIAFAITHVTGFMAWKGGYLATFIPHIDAPSPFVKWPLVVGIAILEYLTAIIRALVLAVRLFANMLAGHAALFMLLFFIKMASQPEWQAYIGGPEWVQASAYWLVMPMSVTLVTLLSLLELFVAGLQAFVFTFLTAIFIGLAKHPAH